MAYAESDRDVWSLLLLAATVRSFARMLLGLSDRTEPYMVMGVWRGWHGGGRSLMDFEICYLPINVLAKNVVRLISRFSKMKFHHCWLPNEIYHRKKSFDHPWNIPLLPPSYKNPWRSSLWCGYFLRTAAQTHLALGDGQVPVIARNENLTNLIVILNQIWCLVSCYELGLLVVEA